MINTTECTFDALPHYVKPAFVTEAKIMGRYGVAENRVKATVAGSLELKQCQKARYTHYGPSSRSRPCTCGISGTR